MYAICESLYVIDVIIHYISQMVDESKIFSTSKAVARHSLLFRISCSIAQVRVNAIFPAIMDIISLLQAIGCLHQLWLGHIPIADIIFNVPIFPKMIEKYASANYSTICIAIFIAYTVARTAAFMLTPKASQKDSALLKLNFILMYVFESIISIPIALFSLYLFKCRGNCMATINKVIVGICALVIIINLLFSILSFHCITAYYFRSTIYTKFQPAKLRYIKLFRNILLSWYATMDYTSKPSTVIILVLIALMDVLLIVIGNMVSFGMNAIAFIILITSCLSTLVLTFSSFAFMLLSSKLTISSLLVMVLSICIIGVIIAVRHTHNLSAIEEYYDVNSEAYMHLYMQTVIKYLKSKEVSYKFQTELIKLFQLHISKCSDSQCFCKSVLNNPLEKSGILNFKDFTENNFVEWKNAYMRLFESISQRNDKLFMMKFFLAGYYKIVEKNYLKAHYTLSNLTPSTIDITYCFLIFMEIVRIDKSVKTHESNIKIDINKIAIYEYHFDKLTIATEKAVEYVISYYNYLIINIDKCDMLVDLGLKITQQITDFFSNFKSILSIFSDSIAAHKLYSKFNKIVLQNELESYYSLEKAQNIERTILINKRMKSNNDLVYSHNSNALVIVISTSEGKMGIVELVNNSISVLGYEKSEIKNSNVTHIIPNIIAQEHNEFLTSYIHYGTSVLLGKARIVFAQCRNGLITPIQLCLRTFPNLQNGLHVISFILFDKNIIKRTFSKVPYELSNHQFNFILSSFSGILQGMTEGAAKLFGLKDHYFQPNKCLFTEPIQMNKIIKDFNSEEEGKLTECGSELILNGAALYQYLDKDSVSEEDLEKIKNLDQFKAFVYKQIDDYQDKIKLWVILIIECTTQKKDIDSVKMADELQLDLIEQQSIASSQNTLISAREEARDSKVSIANNKSPKVLLAYERLYLIVLAEMLVALFVFYTISKFVFSMYAPRYSMLMNLALESEYQTIAAEAFNTMCHIDNGFECKSNSLSVDRRSTSSSIAKATLNNLIDLQAKLDEYYTINNITKLVEYNNKVSITEYIFNKGKFDIANTTFKLMYGSLLSILSTLLNKQNLFSPFYISVFNGTMVESSFANYIERSMVWVQKNNFLALQESFINMRKYYSLEVNDTSAFLSSCLEWTITVQLFIIICLATISQIMTLKMKRCYLYIFNILSELNITDIRTQVGELKDYFSNNNANAKLIKPLTNMSNDEAMPFLKRRGSKTVTEIDDQFKTRQKAKLKKIKYTNMKLRIVLGIAFLFMLIIMVIYYTYLKQSFKTLQNIGDYNLNIIIYRYISLVKCITIIKSKLIDIGYNTTLLPLFLNRAISTESNLYSSFDTMPTQLSQIKDTILQYDSPLFCEQIKDNITIEFYGKCGTALDGIATKGLRFAMGKVISRVHEYKMLFDSNNMTRQQLHTILNSTQFSEIEDMYIIYMRAALYNILNKCLTIIDNVVVANSKDFLLEFIGLFIFTVLAATALLLIILRIIQQEVMSYRGMVATLPYSSYKQSRKNQDFDVIFK